MKMLNCITVEDGGKITLPSDLQHRYGLATDTRIRIIEARNGILLVPVTAEPISDELAAELSEWQSLGNASMAMFPYDEG